MKILLVPEFMGDGHWLLMATFFWFLASYSWFLFWDAKNVRTIAYAIVWTSAAVIASCFWLIQSETTPISPVTLFAVERAFWWPMALGAAVLVDLHAADLNGHRSLITRLHRRFCNHSERLCR